MSDLKVKFHGILASNKDHSCIEVDYQDTHLLIQPTKRIEGINAVVICDTDADEWSQWKYYADNGVPIYSTLGVKHYIPDKDLRAIIKTIGTNFKIGNLKVIPEKTPVAPHEPMIGLRFPQFRVAILPELPSYLGQQLIKDISLPPHHLIAGIGSYSKPNHKINFINFADRILASKEHKGLLSITLTNFRLDLLRRKDEVLKRLRKDWDVPIMFAKKGMLLTFTRDGKVIKGDQIKSKLHLEEFRNTGMDYDLKHPGTRWREIMADARYLGNTAFPRLLKGKKWGDWTLEDVEKYFAKCIDTLRSIGFIIPEKHNDSSFWKLYWRCKRKGLIKSSPPKTKEEKEEWDRKRLRILQKALVAAYFSKSKPAYRCDIDLIESDLKHLGWDKKDLLIDSKADGLRITALKLKGKGYVFVDPEDLKHKSPNVSSRVPAIIRELEDNLPDGTVLDGEFIAMVGNEVIHRTISNSIINSKVDAEKLAPFAYIFVFDVLFYAGKDLRKLPLSERLKYLSKIKESEHIIVERPSHEIKEGYPAYYVGGSNFKGIHKIWNIITNDKGLKRHGKFIKHLAEGVMIKTLDGIYQVPQNKSQAKVKVWREIDGVILDKKLIKGAKKTWNYLLGLDIPKDYAKVLASMSKKSWYDSAGVLVGKTLYRGKEILDKNGRWVMVMTKTDNTNIQGEIGDILRIAAEEVIKYENEEHPDYPRYSFYIGRPLELVPEKNVSDSLQVLERLSLLEPKRMSIEDLLHIRGEKLPKELKRIAEKVKALSDNQLWELRKYLNER